MNLKLVEYRVSPDVFQLFPGYMRAVVTLFAASNKQSPVMVSNLLNSESEKIGATLRIEDLLDEPHLAAWRTAFKKAGFTSDFRPSFEALIRRAINNPEGLRPINTMVDLGNYFSLKFRIPVGVHEITPSLQSITLQPATGEEVFEEFGTEKVEHPVPGEIIFTDGNNVMTRRWIWRQGKNSIITPETTAVFINLDALPPFDLTRLKLISLEVAETFKALCGGVCSVNFLTEDRPVFHINFPIENMPEQKPALWFDEHNVID